VETREKLKKLIKQKRCLCFERFEKFFFGKKIGNFFHKKLFKISQNMQELITFIDSSNFSFPSEKEKRQLSDLIDEWFEQELFNENYDAYIRIASYTEDEELLIKMFETFFSQKLKNSVFGLLCFRAAYGFLEDQSEVCSQIFENIDKLRYINLLDRLDGYPGEFERRSEAESFFEKALKPYAKNQEDWERFSKWFQEEMTFPEVEPKMKKNKV